MNVYDCIIFNPKDDFIRKNNQTECQLKIVLRSISPNFVRQEKWSWCLAFYKKHCSISPTIKQQLPKEASYSVRAKNLCSKVGKIDPRSIIGKLELWNCKIIKLILISTTKRRKYYFYNLGLVMIQHFWSREIFVKFFFMLYSST